MRNHNRLTATLLFLTALLVLTGCLRPYTYHGMLLESPNPAADFSLTDASGDQVSLSDFRGKLVVLYFGYTFCPDVCPTTMSDLAQAMKKLGAKADDVQVIMVSVDPERDAPQKIAEYVSYFDPRFIGLTGTPEEVAAATTPFGIYYQKHEGTVATGYLVDHTATMNVIDKEGRMRLVLPFGTPAADIADDLAHLLE